MTEPTESTAVSAGFCVIANNKYFSLPNILNTFNFFYTIMAQYHNIIYTDAVRTHGNNERPGHKRWLHASADNAADYKQLRLFWFRQKWLQCHRSYPVAFGPRQDRWFFCRHLLASWSAKIFHADQDAFLSARA